MVKTDVERFQVRQGSVEGSLDVSEPVHEYTNLTPSGIEVFYSPSPRRHYKVRAKVTVESLDYGGTLESEEEILEVMDHVPMSEWREVPSVTSVLGVLDKPGLPWWGMKVGVEGVLELHSQGALRSVAVTDGAQFHNVLGALGDDGGFVVAGVEQVVSLLTANKITVNHQRDKAGARGTAVHDAFELWAADGTIPDPEMFPDEQRGYVVGLNAFLADAQPEPVEAEVMVGSVAHGFAGRYDVRLRITKERQVVYKRTPVKGAQYATISPGLILGDLKTSSGVYPSHSRQLEAYEGASIECGYEPTNARGIIHVSADGTYEFVRSTATYEDFLCVLAVWKSDQAMKARKAK